MKELKFEELSIKQKLGMVFTPFLNSWAKSEPDEEFVLNLIKERALGSVWIQQGYRDAEVMLKRVKELADYPIIIMTDAESGIESSEGRYIVGRHSAISSTGDPKYAYAFGKVLGTKAHKMGYNMVCNPIVDILPGAIRSLGGDKEKVTKYAIAMARGMHDGGVMTIAKHYPGGSNPNKIDSHMTESISYDTKEELIESHLYPYKKLLDEGLLDGVMTGHKRMVNIDNNRPASLSKPVIDIIREMGFEGIAITDALCMMGIRAKYSEVEAKGYAIAAGNDLLLPFTQDNRVKFGRLVEAYEQGLIPDDMLDAAVRRVLAAQHKTTLLTDDAEISEEELRLFFDINKDNICAVTDEGLLPSIPRDGKHFFAMLVRNEMSIGADGKIDVDTFSSNWLYPEKVREKILDLFPNSRVEYIYEFPTQAQNTRILTQSLGCDELIFLTFTEPLSFVGEERLTHRIVTLIKALQHTDRLSTVVHFGNPLVLEELPHIPRLIIGSLSTENVDSCLEVLAGNYPTKGVLNCSPEFK